ncbi:unnamed protein product [Ambrosiozyma monospora]|uniref:Unnamed protein product n=1 Tax=Ambrosiozyma monospora TaxID=43982 RepID=A0A9W6WDR3_AMBMO|nr:unnamed protein product [Ambrosiozyma monospora]
MYNNQLPKENPLWDLAYWEATKGLAEFTSWVNDELIVGDCSGDKIVSIQPDELLQIVSAVRSRTLEIPRAAGKSEEEDKKDENNVDDNDNEDSFFTDISLVPVIDFVNHDNARLNAYFDVDKQTQDILLKLDSDTLLNVGNNEIVEVFISYSKIEDVNRFFFNYGFIPTSNYPEKLFEIPFWGHSEGYITNHQDNDDDIKPDGKQGEFEFA